MKPFSGLLVADFTHVLSGPFCTMMLSDLGARVIKLERPEIGDDSRQFGPMYQDKSMYFETVNRGKESVTVDLKSPDDVRWVKNLLKKADVVVENFKPGTMNKLGLDYTSVKQLNDKIIYASISGFGQFGSMSQLPAYDEVIQAMSGFMSVTGDPNGSPMKAGPAVSDMLAGVYCFASIATALYQREKTKQGCHIDIAMLDCMIAFLSSDVPCDRVLHTLPVRVGNKHRNIAPFRTFRCKDGELVICAATDKLFQTTCDVLNLPELKTNPACQTNIARLQQDQLIEREFEKVLIHHPVKYWYQCFLKAGVPVSPINNVTEALDLPVINERDMIVSANEYILPGCPIKLSSFTDTKIRNPAPNLNQNGDDIRREFKEDES